MFGVELLQPKAALGLPAQLHRFAPGQPGDLRHVASQVFVREDETETTSIPGKAPAMRCRRSTMARSSMRTAQNYGYYCGSYQDVGYGTLENGRKAANFYGSATYHVTDSMDLFLDLQAGTSHQDSYNTPLQWENSYPLNGDSTPIPFYNSGDRPDRAMAAPLFHDRGKRRLQSRRDPQHQQHAVAEHRHQGHLRSEHWNYEALFGHSQNELESKWPALVSAKAQALYLGPSLGIDPDSGYRSTTRRSAAVHAADGRRSSARSRRTRSTTTRAARRTSRSRVSNTELFHLPAGPVGFAGVAEYGNQYFGLKADPLSLDGSYYGLHNTDAVGSRNHAGLGVEFSVPVFSQTDADRGRRYDKYEYGDNAAGKFTYALGLEYRPIDSLLLRGSDGTGFRAPDLSYLYAGLSGSSSGGTDYYLCRRDEPDTGPDFVDNCNYGDVDFNGRSHGSTTLKDETSKSFTYGFVYSPIPNIDFSADYYNIKLNNEVEYQDSDTILREEADCRLGKTVDGKPVDINSSFCQQVISQVVRNSPTDPSNPRASPRCWCCRSTPRWTTPPASISTRITCSTPTASASSTSTSAPPT